MKSRSVIAGLAALLLAVACGGSTSSSGGGSSAAPLTRANLIWVAKVANMAPALVAVDAGYFSKHGLDINLSYVNGSPNGIAALLAGDADFLQVAGTAVVTAAVQSKDSDKTPTLILGTVNRAVWKLMANKSLTGINQLKGKTVCITKVGTADQIGLNLYLKRVGIDPAKDITVIAGGTIEGCVATLEAGRAQAGVFSTPATAQLQSAGFGVLADFAKENIEIQQLGAAVTKGYAKAHPDLVLNFVRAYIEGIHRFKTDRVFAEKVMSKYLDTTDKTALDDAFDTYKEIFEKVPIPTTNSLQSIIDTIPEARGKSPSEFYDPSFVQKLDKEGFIKQLYGS